MLQRIPRQMTRLSVSHYVYLFYDDRFDPPRIESTNLGNTLPDSLNASPDSDFTYIIKLDDKSKIPIWASLDRLYEVKIEASHNNPHGQDVLSNESLREVLAKHAEGLSSTERRAVRQGRSTLRVIHWPGVAIHAVTFIALLGLVCSSIRAVRWFWRRSRLPTSQCFNCGFELLDGFCHECGSRVA
jgi:hypothetical protein